MNRRNLIKGFGLGIAAGTLGIVSKSDEAMANEYAKATKGLPALKITNVKAILTAPQRIRLCVVKVETSEPGLYGLGCATFNQRPLPVVSAVDNYLNLVDTIVVPGKLGRLLFRILSDSFRYIDMFAANREKQISSP